MKIKDILRNLTDDTRLLWKPFSVHKRIYSFFRYKEIKMCILGDKFAGKTCLYSYYERQNEPFYNRQYTIVPKATNNSREVTELSLQSSEDIKLSIEAGTDITGAREKVCVYYKKKVFENDLIIYLFNSSTFSTDNQDNRKLVVAHLYLISILIAEKERNLKLKIDELKKKDNLTKDEKKELEQLEYRLTGGTTLMIVPTWKIACCKNEDVDLKNILEDELLKSSFLNEAIVQNKNVRICNMYELIDHNNGSNCLNVKELRKLTDEIISFYTDNLKRNHKWIL